MCRRIACRTCGKPTYSGCGMHVEQVLAGIPRSQRCSCPPKEQASGSWLGRLFGRR